MLLRQKKDLSYENLDFPGKHILSGGRRFKSSYKNRNYFFSIITVVLNNVNYIEDTIKTVINQREDVEYIIIDGGSKDGTLNIIKKYEDYIDLWTSHKDNGIYDAMNKGIKFSSGKFIGILNSGDLYNANSLSIIKKYFISKKNLDFVFGTVQKKTLKYGFKKNKIFWSFDFYPSHSSGFFISRTAQKRIGLYDTNFKLSADHDFFYRMLNDKFRGTATRKDELIGFFRKIGGSYSSTFSAEEHLAEEVNIRKKNKQNNIIICLLIINSFLRNLFKKKKYSITFKTTCKLVSNVFKQN